MAETYASLSAMLAVLVDRDPVQDTDFASALPSLFERAERKVKLIEDIDLPDHADWPNFVADYRIGVEPDPGPVERS